ncbi:hypothetical protein DYI23_21220 [Roseibium polysiphoniae]|uniref:Uncharacterized protein n=1 Tax=Roseibium polysiphoniae TaxID=2571221 RepID=A0A944GVG4_9HYPH|nr:hypothetical protein [Roseibium polysiphoniae]MBS8262761.1 hypothetical protein [Roseibium polysiphoniae]
MAVKRNKSRRTAANSERPALTPLQKVLLDEADRKVSIVSDGAQQDVSIHQLVSRKLLQMAANGSVHALSNAINEINTAQSLKQQQINDDVEFGKKYKDHQQRRLDQAIANGEDPERVLPHPDDVQVVLNKGYRIAGPADENELKIIRTNCAFRDVLNLQAVLEERIGGDSTDPEGEATEEPFAGATAMMLAHVMNMGLPERFTKSDADLARDLMRHGRMTKRELLKKTHRAWASIQKPKPRGWTLLPYQQTLTRFEQCASLCLGIADQTQDGKRTSEKEFAAEIIKVL